MRMLKDKKEFDEVLSSSGNKLVVIDFTATWCGPCQHIAPIFEKMAEEHKEHAVLVKVDVDANEETAAACGVRCMPTFMFYKQGKKVHEFSGADEKKLKDAIEQHK